MPERLFPGIDPDALTLTLSGIDKGVRHADRIYRDPPWSEMAWEFLLTYLSERPGQGFLTEDLREAAAGKVPDPPDKRSWGGVMARASRLGIIRCVGFRRMKSKHCHCNPKMVWLGASGARKEKQRIEIENF